MVFGLWASLVALPLKRFVCPKHTRSQSYNTDEWWVWQGILSQSAELDEDRGFYRVCHIIAQLLYAMQQSLWFAGRRVSSIR